MKVLTYPLQELPPELFEQWRSIQRSNPALAGPCFHPALYRTVGAFLPSARIAVIEEEKDPLVLSKISQWKHERFGGFFKWGHEALKKIQSGREEGLEGGANAFVFETARAVAKIARGTKR